jgi:hypothetical protein
MSGRPFLRDGVSEVCHRDGNVLAIATGPSMAKMPCAVAWIEAFAAPGRGDTGALAGLFIRASHW